MMSAHRMTLNDRRFHFVWAVLAAYLLGGVLGSAQTIGFVPGNPSVNENGSNVTLVVTRSPATGNSTVDFASRDQTATAGLDYLAVFGTLRFTNGETFKTIVVPILDDTNAEPHETFEVILSNPVGGVLGRSNVVVTIIDNDTLLSFTAANYSFSEDSPNAVITVSRAGGPSGAASVTVFTRDGTATAGSDYVATSSTLLFTNGQTTATLLIPLIDDCVVEGNETFSVFLTNVFGASLGAISNATVTIVDNDSLAGTLVIRSVTPTNAVEGGFVLVTIGRNCAFAGPVSVDLVPLNNNPNSSTNALLGLDYAFATSNTVSWVAGDFTDKIVAINIINDNLVELNEAIVLGLANVTGGAFINANASTAVITIGFDDSPAGAADRTYNPVTALNPTPGANNTVYAVAVDTNPASANFGKTFIVGDFTSVNGAVRNRVALLDVNGALDASFDPLDGADGSVSAIVVQPDGRIVIGGSFAAINGVPRAGVARLNANGTLDLTFDPGSGLDGAISALALQADGKVVVVGDFATVGGETRRQVARLNANGAVDLTFDAGLGPNSSALAVALLPSVGGAPQQILVGGSFSTFNGTNFNRIVRLNGNGSVDLAFLPVSGVDGVVFAIAVQPNGAVLLGGSFNTYDGVSRRSVVRVTANGLLDPSFNPGSAVEGSVYDVRLQPDGSVLLAGQFTAFGGVPRNNVARLNPDGTLDTGFLDPYYNQSQPGTDGLVLSLGLQPDGSVLIGGSFANVGGGQLVGDILPRLNFARLIGGVPPPPLNMPGNVEFVTASYSVDENVASGVVTISVRRLNGNLLPVSVDYTTVDGSAIAGVDYQATSGTVSWLDKEPLANLKTFSISLINNAIPDGNRAFSLTLSNPRSGAAAPTTGPALGFQTTAAVTIIDDDFTVGVLGFLGPVFEVSEAVGNATITIVRTNGATGAVSVQYATAPGTATANVDYLPRSGTLLFASGQTSRTFTIPIINDVAPEFEESVLLSLANPTGGAKLGLANAVLLIMDNEFGPGSFGSLSFTTNNFAVNETNGTLTVNVRRTSGSVGSVEVDVQTFDFPLAPGNARAGLDYGPINTHVIFPAGVVNQAVTVAIAQDRLVEGVEVFGLRLANISGGANYGYLSNSVGSIIDANSYGQITFSEPAYFITENGGTAVIPVNRVGGDAEQVAVQYFTQAGTAVPGQHYFDRAGTFIFADGQTTTNILIPIINDLLAQPNRTVSIILSNFSKATPGRFTNATLTIFDDESLVAPAGSLNTAFDTSLGANGAINALALQAGGKLVIGGEFTAYGGLAINRIARLNPDGGVDTQFQPGTGANAVILTMALQPFDQKLVIGGRFTTYNGANRNYLTRLYADGSLDSSFNTGSGPDNPIFAAAVRPDGKIALGGSFTTFNGVPRANFVVLNTNGAVDSLTNPGAGVNGPVFAVAVQPDGKMVIGGEFTVVNNTNRVRIARLNADGSLDTTFNPPGGANDGAVRALAVQADGKIVVGGTFTKANGVTRNHLARFNVDGSLDTTFLDAPAAGANDDVLALVVQPDGRILVGGTFTNFNTIGRYYLTRLTTEGAVDPTMNFGLGANNSVFAIAPQPDGQINIAGAFTLFDGLPRNRLARILGGDNFGAGSLQFSDVNYSLSENQTNATITVRRIGGSEGVATVVYATSDGSARAGRDYAGTTNGLIFPSGEVTRVFQVGVSNNLIIDGDRTVTLTLSGATGATIGAPAVATLTILDDDVLLNFSSVSYTVIENIPGGRVFISVDRLGGSVGAVSVQYLTSTGGTAVPYFGSGPVGNASYTNTQGTLTWRDGETGSKTFPIGIIDDAITNANRTVNLGLFGATNLSTAVPIVLTGRTNAVLTIVDNEFGRGIVGFSLPNFTVSENTNLAVITVFRTNGSLGTVSVNYSTTGSGSALPGVDFRPVNGTLNWADNDSTPRTFTVPILDNFVTNATKTVDLVLSGLTPGVAAGLVNATLTIIDNDSVLTFRVPNFSLSETGGVATIEVLRLGSTADPVSVNYATVGGTAAAAGPFAKYFPTNGLLNFASGVVTQSFNIVILDNGVVDGDQTVNLSLTNVTSFPVGSASLGLSNAVLTIVDNDISVQFTRPTFSVLENGGQVAIGVTRAGLSGVGVTVDFGAINSSAVAGLDYGPTNGTLNFGPGVTNLVFAVAVINNSVLNTDRTVNLFLTNAVGPTGTRLGTLSNAVLTIFDDETVAPPAGLVDPTFNAQLGANGPVYAASFYTNGQLLVAGNFTAINGGSAVRVARLNADGTLDVTFNPGAGPDAVVYAAAITAVNGPVLIGGDFARVNGTNQAYLARLTAGGVLDQTFNIGAGPNSTVFALTVQSNGQILVGGQFFSFNGASVQGIVRLNADGSVDGGFNAASGSGTVGAVYAIAVQPDGKILIGGDFTAVNGVTNLNRIARLNADGSLDANFSAGTGADRRVTAIVVQPDGAILVGGAFVTFNGLTKNGITRLNLNGSTDATFNAGTGGNGGPVTSLALKGDGKILVGGDFTTFNGQNRSRFARLNATGAIDLTFNPGSGADRIVNAVAVLVPPTVNQLFQTNAIFISDDSFLHRNGPATNVINVGANAGRINLNFSPDFSTDIVSVYYDGVRLLQANSASFSFFIGASFSVPFGPGTSTVVTVTMNENRAFGFWNYTGTVIPSNAVAGASGGAADRSIIAGDFSVVNGQLRDRIAQLNEDGTMDLTFGVSSSATVVQAMGINTNPAVPLLIGKTVVGGNFSVLNGANANRVARLNLDGSVDLTFNTGSGTNGGANDTVGSLVVQPDGRVVIGGLFTRVNGTNRNFIARLNADGSLDTSFDTFVGANNPVYALALQADGRVLVGGLFTLMNGTARNFIARLNPDGTVDPLFNTGPGADGLVRAIAIQPDGKILIGGDFATYDGTPRTRLARLNADGSLDATFNPGAGADASVLTLAIRPSGRILVGGAFATVGGVARSGLAQLTALGAVDGAFSPGTGFDSYVSALGLQADGRVFVGGGFSHFNGVPANRMVRLNVSGALDTSINFGSTPPR